MRKRKKRAGRWLPGILAWILALTMMTTSSFAAWGGVEAAALNPEQHEAVVRSVDNPDPSTGTAGTDQDDLSAGDTVTGNLEQPKGNGETGNLEQPKEGGETGNLDQPKEGDETGNLDQPKGNGETGNLEQPKGNGETGNLEQPKEGGETGNLDQPKEGDETGNLDQPKGNGEMGNQEQPGQTVKFAVAVAAEALMAAEATGTAGSAPQARATTALDVTREVTAQGVMDAIATRYADSGTPTDPWVVAEMGAYARAFPDTRNKLTDAQKQGYLDALIPKAEKATSPGDLAKYIIALRSMGYDARKLVKADGTAIDIVQKLTDMVDARSTAVTSIYTLPYVLIALQQGSGYATQTQIDFLKNAAVASKADWIKESWGTIDSAPPMILALAPYSGESTVETVLDEAVAFVVGKQTATGAVGNANSTGITMAAFAAVGKSPASVQKNGKSLVDGLMAEVSDTGDGFKYGSSSANNAMATEQGFRGLVAAALQSQSGGRIFDFASMPMNTARMSGAPTTCPVKVSVTPVDAAVEVKLGSAVQAGKGANAYDLAAGSYTYTATKQGYQTATGSFEVTAADIASQQEKQISVSLVPASGGEAQPDLNITVKVLTHDGKACGGTWTYRSNADQYKTIASTTVTVKPGASAFEVFDKVLRENSISYTEKDGYISEIAGDAELGHGSANSGWHYMVNGAQPLVGVRAYKLEADAALTLFYTDDYTRESASGGGSGVAGLPARFEDACKAAREYLQGRVSSIQVGSVGGEWMLLGLARSGALAEKAAADYYAVAEKYITENTNEKEQLHRAKSTENARVILGLTAIGRDVTSVAGHNLLVGLTDMEYVKKQGINGLVWALIAFDSHNYDIPAGGTVTREGLVQAILDAQLADGGWSLSGEAADPDMTGMALCALAPYGGSAGDSRVQAAITKGLENLSGTQQADGGYLSNASGSAAITAESSAQVITALTALGINPATDSRFIKNGHSVMDALLSFHVEGSGFRHVAGGEVDGMATEQGYYALVAYQRMQEGKTSLYDMKDIGIKKAETSAKEYHIMAGTDDQWTVNDDGSVAIRADGAIEEFVSLKVDGKLVDRDNYTLKSGSTIVILKPEFLKSLGEGNHEVTFVYQYGEVAMTLPLAAGGTPVRKAASNPGGGTPGVGQPVNGAPVNKEPAKGTANAADTGDQNAPAAYGAMLLASLACIAAVYGIRRKNRAAK